MECVGREITVRVQWFSLLGRASDVSPTVNFISSTDITAGLLGASKMDCV